MLLVHVDRAHVDLALQTHQSSGGSKRNAVLACARFRDERLLAHALGQKGLTKAVVDLVRTGVVEVLALEVHLGAAELTGQVLGKVQERWAAHVVGQELLELVIELGVVDGFLVGGCDLCNRANQMRRKRSATVCAKVSLAISLVLLGQVRGCGITREGFSHSCSFEKAAEVRCCASIRPFSPATRLSV